MGNATGDDITITGYVASSILPKTSAASDLGSSTQNWQSLYLDNGATDGGAIYFDAGTSEFIKAIADGTDLQIGGFTGLDLGGTSGTIAEIKTFGLSEVAKSADYTVLDNDGHSIIYMTTGSSTDKTVTLPTAADNAGRVITVKKVDSGTNALILVDDAGDSALIDGAASQSLYTAFEFLSVQSDGSTWHIIGGERKNRYEYKALAASSGGDITTNNVDFLEFTGLNSGRVYRFEGSIRFDSVSTETFMAAYIRGGTTNIITLGTRDDDNSNAYGLNLGFSYVFTGQTSIKLRSVALDAGSKILGNDGSTDRSYAILTELNNTAVTTAF